MTSYNILFLLGVYPNYGGTEKITTILANKFAKIGYSVHIVSFDQPVLDLKDDLDNNIALYKLNYPVFSRKNIIDLHEIIKKNKIDIIINQWCLPFHTTVLCNFARKNTSCKLISVLHGIPHRSKREIEACDKVDRSRGVVDKNINKIKLFLIKNIIRMSLYYVYNNSDSYVLLSKGYLSIFNRESGINDSNKLLFIPNPITIQEPKLDINSIINTKEKIILYVGRMDYENKRTNRIVEAWQDIFHKYPEWKLVLVGDGPHKKNLEKYVFENNIDRVVFTGFIKEDPISYYMQSSIFLLTSDLEGFGLVLIESMVYGVVPIVYGSYEAAFDIVDHEKNGYITTVPYQKENTIEYLIDLIEDEKDRKEKAIAAYQKAKQFSLDEIVKEWQDLFNRVV